METFVRGDVVVVPFPLSAEESFKRRPAVVLASWPFGRRRDYLLCLITSQIALDPYILHLSDADIEGGSLGRQSYVRPTYLISVDGSRITGRIGTLSAEKLHAVIDTLIGLLT